MDDIRRCFFALRSSPEYSSATVPPHQLAPSDRMRDKRSGARLFSYPEPDKKGRHARGGSNPSANKTPHQPQRIPKSKPYARIIKNIRQLRCGIGASPRFATTPSNRCLMLSRHSSALFRTFGRPPPETFRTELPGWTDRSHNFSCHGLPSVAPPYLVRHHQYQRLSRRHYSFIAPLDRLKIDRPSP